MTERELQDYLFEHPDLLVPEEAILEKHREFCIEGKRIDLLFRGKDTQYIVELKAVPLKREHLGQIVEYYGLLRSRIKSGKFQLILVSPSIAAFQKPFLEELGIRCIEISSIPDELDGTSGLRDQAIAQRRRQIANEDLEKEFPVDHGVRYDDLVTGVRRHSLAISHRFLRETLPQIRTWFSAYEVLPIKMVGTGSFDRILPSIPAKIDEITQFVPGGTWWAYAFGESEKMPKNSVPNISAIVMPWGLDLAINAELITSQSVLIKRMAEEPTVFDDLLRGHGGLEFQGLLKLEHQPRFYFWIPIFLMKPCTFDGTAILEEVGRARREYRDLRQTWIENVVRSHPEMSAAQYEHMSRRNLHLNLALRLVRPFHQDDPFWTLSFEQQVHLLLEECRRLKGLIDFLR